MLGKDHALLERIRAMREEVGRRQESPSGHCRGCIYLGSFWTRRCQLSDEQTPACQHQMPKGFFIGGDSHGH